MSDTKICTKCDEELAATSENFNKHPNGQYGLNPKCKNCEKAYKKAYREKNKARLAAEEKQRYEDNRESVLAQRLEFRNKNRELLRERDREWKEKNPEKVKASRKKHYEKVKDTDEYKIMSIEARIKYKTKRKERHLERMRTDPQYKLGDILRKSVNKYLKGYKSDHTIELLGCSIAEFQEHLESQFIEGMSWENYGVYRVDEERRWHCDHILPCTSFDLTDPEQQKECFHYTNFQPLWGDLNISKGNKKGWQPNK